MEEGGGVGRGAIVEEEKIEKEVFLAGKKVGVRKKHFILIVTMEAFWTKHFDLWLPKIAKFCEENKPGLMKEDLRCRSQDFWAL